MKNSMIAGTNEIETEEIVLPGYNQFNGNNLPSTNFSARSIMGIMNSDCYEEMVHEWAFSYLKSKCGTCLFIGWEGQEI